MKNQAFTLIELLVVVLIIGILAAIAVPQYQMAIGKAKFTEVKNIIRNIFESEQRYYLITNSYPANIDELDINFNITKKSSYKISSDRDDMGYKFTTSSGVSCNVWYNTILCSKKIFGEDISIYAYRNILRYQQCAVSGGFDSDTKANRLCQLDVGHRKGTCYSQHHYCGYVYVKR